MAAAKTELEGKIDTAKTEAITEAGTKADEKVAAAKTELKGNIATAKTEAIAEAGKKVDAAKTELTEKITEAKMAADKAATDKSATARKEAVKEAGTKADEKIDTAKKAIAEDIKTAKEEAINTAGTNADKKLNEAKAALDQKLGNLDTTTVKLEKYDKDIASLQEKDKNHEARLTTVENDVKIVGANAAALAALKPLQYNPGQTTQVMAGVGTYRGKTAVALGAAHYASENLMYHAGVSFGNGNGAMANAGVTIGFGSGEGAKMNSSKVAELQSAVDRLTAENEQVKAALYDIYAKLQAK